MKYYKQKAEEFISQDATRYVIYPEMKGVGIEQFAAYLDAEEAKHQCGDGCDTITHNSKPTEVEKECEHDFLIADLMSKGGRIERGFCSKCGKHNPHQAGEVEEIEELNFGHFHAYGMGGISSGLDNYFIPHDMNTLAKKINELIRVVNKLIKK